MKQNTKFLWIYAAILFSFALILIVFAGLTQNNYQKEIEQQATESAGIKRSLVTLTSENQKISDELKGLSSEVANLKTENFKMNLEKEILIKSIGGNEELTKLLIDAYVILSIGDAQTAKAKIAPIDKKQLGTAQLRIYNTIMESE